MPRLNFGAFLAPHHPIGEHPMLQFRRDLEFVEHLDKLGYDEFWCGEHHSTGWEMIASPEMFLAAAGERTKRIKLATGVVSLPYHHPFNVAQRMIQLDYMTGGRAIFGSGPGAEDRASARHVVELDHPLCHVERMVIGQGDHTGRELDPLRSLACRGQEHLGRGDHLPAGGMMLAAPELVVAELVQVLHELEVTAE